jgi:hypothetical protein
MRRNRKPIRALPLGINMKDFLWEPDEAERFVDRVRQLQKVWHREDLERLRRREKLIALEIEDAKRKQAIEDARAEEAREREAEIERRKTYWVREREAGAAAMEKLIASYEAELNVEHGKRLKKLAQIEKDIARDKLKIERQALAQRGVLRGRK